MLPIKYPLGQEKNSFELEYINSIFKEDADVSNFQKKLDEILTRIGYGGKINIKELLVLDIEKLVDITVDINKVSDDTAEEELKKLFNYSDKEISKTTYQPKISYFYATQQHVRLKTCFYCNIDYINPFIGINDYNSTKDFLFNSYHDELTSIFGIGPETAKKIIDSRKTTTKVTGLNITEKKLEIIRNVDLSNLDVSLLDHKSTFSHFTLDHLLNKASHPIVALSLYNFVPSCYSCNSKFKRDKALICKDTISNSPTSSKFNFHKKASFKYVLKPKIDISMVRNLNEFSVKLDSNEDLELYSTLFRLEQRYKEHKDIALDLLKTRNKYSDSQLQELSKKLNIPIKTIKETIFGKEIFSKDESKNSFTKYKKDLSRQLKLIK